MVIKIGVQRINKESFENVARRVGDENKRQPWKM